MRYIPHTPDDIRKMLDSIGVGEISELFCAIPQNIRLNKALNIPSPMSEKELLEHLENLSASNLGHSFACFIGGGAHRHYVPAAVDSLLSRGEFFTAYTPYQPEVSQGTLQAIFEFQTMIARLLGMEAANASMYDGASALAEAILMAARVTKKSKALIASSINPRYRQVVETYLQFHNFELTTLPIRADGRVDSDFISNADLSETAAVVVQSPNYFGVIEDLSHINSALRESKAQFIVSFTEALAYGLIKSPGECGADIVAGEGASFGMPVSFGGPFLGLFAARKKHARMIPGRLVGQTLDTNGKKAFVLTLATREQHIRREKATSNICTNQALCALACVIYLSLHGKSGLAQLAQANLNLAEYAKDALVRAGAKLPFNTPTFNEFVVDMPCDVRRLEQACYEQKLLPGISVDRLLSGADNAMLVNVTELNNKDQIDKFARIVAKLK